MQYYGCFAEFEIKDFVHDLELIAELNEYSIMSKTGATLHDIIHIIYKSVINFDQFGIDVISDAQKFIIPVPKLANGGEPLISDTGTPIVNYEGNRIAERGCIFYNKTDRSAQAVQGDSTGVIIINCVNQEQANRLDQKISAYHVALDPLSLSNLKDIISFAQGELGLSDMYNSDKTYIQDTMRPLNTGLQGQNRPYYGLHIRDDKDVCKAVYIEGNGAFLGLAATPQRFEKQAVIVHHGTDYRLIQWEDFRKKYTKPDFSAIQIHDMKKQNINDNTKPLTQYKNQGKLTQSLPAERGYGRH